jgi:hypothetical protein
MNEDPYILLFRRKTINAGEVAEPVQHWSEIDIKKLEEFCNNHNIVGFNCGNVPPLVALRLLKNKLGFCDEGNATGNPTKKQLIYG